MPPSGFLLFLILVICFSQLSLTHVTGKGPVEAVAVEETPMMPLIEEGKMDMMMMMMNDSRRKLEGRFQICGVCTCCGGAKGVCLSSPCCYAINCNIPNRPFGLCAFTPKTCNCFNCHL